MTEVEGLKYRGHPFLQHPPATAETNLAPPATGDAPFHIGSLPPTSVTNVDIDITEACNLACTYCFKSELYGRHMNFQVLKRSFEWLLAASRGAPSVNVNFMGGEPTLRWKDIETFVPWARRRGRQAGTHVTFSMTSNLTLWTEEIRKFVDEYGFGILMSIDGCPEIQDMQRPAKNGRKMSDIVARWAQSLLMTRPNATARMTLHPVNVELLDRSIAYLSGLGFREITISAASYADWTTERFGVLREQLGSVMSRIVDSYRGLGCRINLTVLKYYINKLICHRSDGCESDIARINAPCGAGKGYMMIDYTGDIWPCHRFDGADTDAGADGAFRLGNIFKSGFHKDLQNVFLQMDHSKMRKVSCDTCPVDPVCGGYCPAANLQENGNIYRPHDAFCAWSQMMYDTAESVYVLAKKVGVLDCLLADCAGAEGDGR